MQRLPALLAGAAAGALAATAYFRRQAAAPGAVEAPDPRAEGLRAKLAEARQAAVEEERVEAAERARETTVEDDPEPALPAEPEQTAPAEAPPWPAEPTSPPPADEFEAMRRRVHDEARAAADEMKRSSDKE